jgi:CRISPR/Cas system CSM-associated protein Csm3 (group 7 of RAMP superfamily)
LDGHGKFKGYKLYPTECETFDGNPDLQIEVVPPDTEFCGRIYFERLSDDELKLLMFALGMDDSFDIKLGGFRAEGLGECYMLYDALFVNGENADANELANDYCKEYGKNFGSSIKRFREILNPGTQED